MTRPLEPYIIGTNLVTKFQEHRTINVASRMNKNITGTNLLTRLHNDRTISFTLAIKSHILVRKNAPPPDGHVLQPTGTIFEKNAPSPRGHVFLPTGIMFELVQDIIGINLPMLTSHITKMPCPWRPCFQATVTIFEHVQDIVETNLLTKFHGYWTINVVSIVLTMQMLAPHNAQRTKSDHKSSPSAHCAQLNQHIIKTNILTNFKLDQGIIGTNLLTTFHEDRTRNVPSRVFTRKTATPTGSHVFQQTATTFELNKHII
ncbi:hypothetical protein DPMN_132184 [Dreissena polymorpha]|uniref:Uncharacterized protein n=1 Tax=Dreissena polymorpha TaxID=45954 RepID=A0A9D4FXU7_DREPO|nr:hypothetical protein DPMN_132184 [Dreissena polymorpha]